MGEGRGALGAVALVCGWGGEVGVLLGRVPAIPIYITIEVKLLLKCNARLDGLKTVFSYNLFLNNRLNC